MTTVPPSNTSARTVFYIAASKDKLLATKLEKHLAGLKKQHIIAQWSGCKVTSSMRNLRTLEHALQQASVFLLLISPDFLASDICMTFVQQAIDLSVNGKKIVVPVLLRPALMQDVPFAHLESVPRDGRCVTSWRNRDEAFLDIAEALTELFEHSFPSLPQTQTSPLISSGHSIDMQSQVKRLRLLESMHQRWLKNVLEGQWLRNALLINPTFHELPGAIANPWQSAMQETELRKRPLPDGTSIIDIYDQAQGALLILGAPGMGKTTLLLALMRDLIERAKQYEDHAIPVFFHLAYWKEKRLPLVDWFAQELQDRYSLQANVAWNLVNTQQVLPLLDGLDMLHTETLSACVNTINEYRQAYHALPLVICSRSTEYLEQQARLILHRAVTLQPLTEQQIDLYLASTGKFAAIHEALLKDEALHTLATTPLVLSILTQIDEQMIPYNLNEMTIETRRSIIFTIYVESVLTRGEKHKLYSLLSETRRWLAWLAHEMEIHGHILFFPEHVQPDWLPAKQWSRVYYLCNGLVGGVLSGLALALVGNIAGSHVSAIVAGLVGLLIGSIGFALAARRIRLAAMTRHLVLKRHIGSLLFSLVVWLLVLITNQSGSFVGTLTTLILMFSLLPLLIGQLLKEPSDTLLEEAMTMPPNYGLRQATSNGIRIGSLVSISFGLLVILFQLLGVLTGHFISYLLLALLLGLFSGLILGGLAVLQIKILYWLLWQSRSTPRNYIEFLDYAAKHVLLSKVGSGYIFRYSLMQDYFYTLM